MLLPILSSMRSNKQSSGRWANTPLFAWGSLRQIVEKRGVRPVVVGVVGVLGMAATKASALVTAPILNTVNSASNQAWGPGSQTNIGIIVGNIIQVFLGLLGVIFMVLLTYGGFLWLTSRGEEDKIKSAQNLIVNAIIGTLIVIAAYSITYYVLKRLIEAV